MKATKQDLLSSIQLLEKALVTLSAKTQEQQALIKALTTENESLKIKTLELEAVSQKDLEDYLLVINNMLFDLDKINEPS
jgi:regulator of replication initiation timing